MRPHGHSSGSFHAERAESREKLHDIPQAEKNHRRHGQRENDNERENAGPWIQQNVSPHHPGYGSARTQCRHAGMQIEEYVEQPSSDPADEVKEEISKMPEKVFHVVAEDPEKEHVPRDMQPVGMEKHARDQWQERNFESGMTCQEGRDSRGHHAVRQKKRIGAALRKRRLQADLVNENRDVAENERDVDEGIGARWVEVLKRDEHGKRSRQHVPASDNVSVEEPLVNRINSRP